MMLEFVQQCSLKI